MDLPRSCVSTRVEGNGVFKKVNRFVSPSKGFTVLGFGILKVKVLKMGFYRY